MDDSLSTTNYNKASQQFSDSSSEDSAWYLYFDDPIDGSSIAFSSSFCSKPESSTIFSASASPAASSGHIAKKRKIKPTFVDHDLEDTASSPVCSSKVFESENVCTRLASRDVGLNMLPTQIGELDYDSYSKEKINTTAQTEEIMNSTLEWNEISYTKLREKGLCLVPVSLLFNFQ